MTDEQKLQQLQSEAASREGLTVPGAEEEPVIMGCTDKLAYNYNPQANTDDGQCIYYAAPGNEG